MLPFFVLLVRAVACPRVVPWPAKKIPPIGAPAVSKTPSRKSPIEGAMIAFSHLQTLDDHCGIPDAKGHPSVDLIALDEALTRLAKLDPRQCRIVELRFFVGLSTRETAEVVGLAPRTVTLEWTKARAWLFRELTRK